MDDNSRDILSFLQEIMMVRAKLELENYTLKRQLGRAQEEIKALKIPMTPNPEPLDKKAPRLK